MRFCLSTRWNAHRHSSGESMIEEILRLGFDRVELGYNLTVDLVPGVRRMVEQKAVSVASVHNFCPVPLGVPAGHPELFLLADADRRVRANAVTMTLKSAEFAAECGARFVVVHAGRVKMRDYTRRLIGLYQDGQSFSPRYERLLLKLLMKREKKSPKHLGFLYGSLEQMLPSAEQMGVCIAIENLPSWESVPTEAEMQDLLQHFTSPSLCYWHDVGHGQVRQNLGFVSSVRWLERLSGRMGGMHLHDVLPPAFDHLLPPQGKVEFARLRPFVKPETAVVIEPQADAPEDELREAVRVVGDAWRD